MTCTPSPRQLHTTDPAALADDFTPADGSGGEGATRWLGCPATEHRSAPRPPMVLSPRGHRCHGHPSTWALGPTTPEAA